MRIFAIAGVAALLSLESAAQQPQPPVVRGGVVLVPVDVRVIDRDGKTVTDLTQRDFVVFEDDVRQEIAHFAFLSELAPAPIPGETPAGSRVDLPPRLESRTFLIVLGRGRVNEPADGIRSAINFVRTRLRPRDRIGVIAYDRLAELSSDHEPVIRLLERYRDRHQAIEALIDHWFTDIQLASLRNADNPPAIQRVLDQFFDAPGLPAFRKIENLTPAPRRKEDAGPEPLAGERSGSASTKDFVYNTAAREDPEKIHAAVSYLRYLEGEKHLVYLSESGFTGRVDELASLASDARVTVTVIHTGGVETSWGKNEIVPDHITFMGPSWQTLFKNAAARAIAEDTGGFATLYRYANEALTAIDSSTRSFYSLGYYLTDSSRDGRRRTIKVTVNRPGVRVLHRHAYYAHAGTPPFDHRAALTRSRIDGARGYRLLVKDIPVSVTASVTRGKARDARVDVAVEVDSKQVLFREQDGRHIATLDVGIFVGTRSERQIGETRKRVDLNLAPETFAQMRSEGVRFTASVDVQGDPRYVRAVVYDYQADRLGSAATQIR